MPLIPVLGRQKKADICIFEDSLVYRVSSRTASATQRIPVSKTKGGTNLPTKTQKQKKKKKRKRKTMELKC